MWCRPAMLRLWGMGLGYEIKDAKIVQAV